jgi:hypothetical protein
MTRRHVPTCEACCRSEDDTPGMVSVRKGGMPTWLCFDCLDWLKQLADAARRQFAAEAAE